MQARLLYSMGSDECVEALLQLQVLLGSLPWQLRRALALYPLPAAMGQQQVRGLPDGSIVIGAGLSIALVTEPMILWVACPGHNDQREQPTR